MNNLTLKTFAATVAAVVFVVAGPVSSVSAVRTNSNNGSDNPGNRVTICHATGSLTNPFVVITPNVNGIIHGHYSHQDYRDIIPAFDYKDHGTTKTFAGQNLDKGGQAILDNGCAVPGQGGGQGGGNGDNSGGQVLGATTTVSANAVGAVDAGFGGANAFTLTSLNRVW